MKKITLYILLLLPLFVHAQKKYRLTGYIGVKGGYSFHYQLVFTDSAGMINGYSLTYDDESKAAKALITGRLDRAAKILIFKETEIVSNQGFYSPVTMCLVDATLKYTHENNSMVLTGSIVSKDAGEAYCSSGSVNLVNEEEIVRMWQDAGPKKDTIATPAVAAKKTSAQPHRAVTVIYDTARKSVPASARSVPDKITSGADKMYEWDSDTVVMDIWDGGHIDGDVVSVLYNGHSVLAKYTLTSEKRQLRLPLAGNDINSIVIIAVNEGNEAPNTANILLTDGVKTYPVIAYNETGRSAVIKIKKRQ